MIIIKTRTLTVRDLLTIDEARLNYRSIALRFDTSAGVEEHQLCNIRDGWSGCQWDARITVNGVPDGVSTDYSFDQPFLRCMSSWAASGADIVIE